MLKIKTISAAVMIYVCASFCHALTNYYVVPPPNAGITPPYTNWAWAATNIQDVINISLAGDTIYITNGHYYLADRITVSKGVIIRSFNNEITDPTNTIIDGNNYVGKLVTNGCMYITAATTTVDGLTFTNGYAKYSNGDGGGGIKIDGAGTLITNCIIAGNQARNEDPTPKYMSGGGLYIGAPCTIANCQIISNWAMYRGGGVCTYSADVIFKNCFIGWNTASEAGGVILYTRNVIFNCDIVNNSGPGFSFISANAVVSNCTIRGNSAGFPVPLGLSNLITHCSIIDNYGANGAGGSLAYGITVRNCLIARNTATDQGGGLWIAGGSRWSQVISTGYVESCTIVSNYAPTAGGVYTYSGSVGMFSNTIVCSNTSSGSYKDLNVTGDQTNYFYNSLCKTVSLPPAQGNITNDPLFVDFNSGNYRLVRGSPCINTGANQDWMTGAPDLDRRRRLDKFSGRVDIGCYEYVPSGFMFSGR